MRFAYVKRSLWSQFSRYNSVTGDSESLYIYVRLLFYIFANAQQYQSRVSSKLSFTFTHDILFHSRQFINIIWRIYLEVTKLTCVSAKRTRCPFYTSPELIWKVFQWLMIIDNFSWFVLRMAVICSFCEHTQYDIRLYKATKFEIYFSVIALNFTASWNGCRSHSVINMYVFQLRNYGNFLTFLKNLDLPLCKGPLRYTFLVTKHDRWLWRACNTSLIYFIHKPK